MKSISIDIESRSGVDLGKCGVYKYVESPDFDILLLGYAVDGSEVKVVDLARGEQLPEEVLQAIAGDDVIKWAFNAGFERIRGVPRYAVYCRQACRPSRLSPHTPF